jgi:hypothetical protein
MTRLDYIREVSGMVLRFAAALGRECTPEAAILAAEVIVDHRTAPTLGDVVTFFRDFSRSPSTYLMDAKGNHRDLYTIGVDSISQAFERFMADVAAAERQAEIEAKKALQAEKRAAYEHRLATDPEFAAAENARAEAARNGVLQVLESAAGPMALGLKESIRATYKSRLDGAPTVQDLENTTQL